MPNILRREDVAFWLYDFLDLEALSQLPHFADADRSVYDAILDSVEKIAEERYQPHAQKLDANEPEFRDGSVHIIPEVKEALDAFCEAGLMGASFDADDGGLQLPYLLQTAISAWFSAANWGTSGYTGLTVAAGNLLAEHGSEEQKNRFLRPMIEGRYFGTMALSEPHAGSSVGDIRTRAEPQEDGTYRLFGNKMWISGADHEMSDNIVNLVLAKIPGGPAGVKGISLFIVPRYLINDDGSRGARNDVRLAGLNHKMGCRGTVNCVLNFGDKDGAVGYLVGERHHGLQYMFSMMNEMRIGVGLSAAALAETGYLHALDYARDRTQGRKLTDRDPSTPMVPIIEHADVKRMLLQQKAYAEGALGLCFYAARLADELRAGDQAMQEKAGLLLDILTPIVKSWPSEFGLRANEIAIQVFGGAGYTRDYPVERFYRDNRLNHIHEGTRGIQGLDLLGRKVPMRGGASFKTLVGEIKGTVKEASGMADFADLAEALERAVDLAAATTATMAGKAEQLGQEAYLANATIYLDMLGHVVVAWVWLRQALAADGARADGADALCDGKIAACRYFFRYELPTMESQCALLARLDKTCLETPAEVF
ncbi:acyl-CoA dehydrogenase [Hoeflea prorocentri]|uniref:Acyl-CoA dehydrogenase n=1 Tax=Hoeflea prorocentri TaxID=1922333 RepID=A0A9X3ZFM1_9HYPH|nr:acyl-CoA dehydrogenase [Hoeflea prorocentri]MCY6379842.1 acyl-CoA dehydrogenase [Hoeflea prorocentri]MDA5397642.1 acyl-CoA dehydrogenase [Hoeflea prorocentri]